MLRAICDDLLELADIDVRTLWDRRATETARPAADCTLVSSAEEEQRSFDRLATESDRTLLIAPESDGCLLARCRRVLQLGATLVSPGSELVALASDKCNTANWLQQACLPVPTTFRCCRIGQLPSSFPWPAIVKPVDGAGSQDVRLIDRNAAEQILNGRRAYCVQAYCPGRAASVAMFCGPRQQIPLPACWQHLDPDSFVYRGGSLIVDKKLAWRATQLARHAARCLPDPIGYLGVDLILGPAEDGSEDFILEINPRLTTSYIGLRRITQANLAAAMLDVVAGREVAVSFVDGPLEFETSGQKEL